MRHEEPESQPLHGRALGIAIQGRRRGRKDSERVHLNAGWKSKLPAGEQRCCSVTMVTPRDNRASLGIALPYRSCSRPPGMVLGQFGCAKEEIWRGL